MGFTKMAGCDYNGYIFLSICLASVTPSSSNCTHFCCGRPPLPKRQSWWHNCPSVGPPRLLAKRRGRTQAKAMVLSPQNLNEPLQV